jgi:transposase
VEGVFVVDAAFYSAVNLQQVGELEWLSRVPQTLKAAQHLIDSDVTSLVEQPCQLEGYRLWQHRQTYGDIEQRWILVESQHRSQNDSDWMRPFEKHEKELQRQLKHLCQQVFACQPDATEALLQFKATLSCHQLVHVSLVPVGPKRPPGRPKRDAPPPPVHGYQWHAGLERTPDFAHRHRQRYSRFILATNILDEQRYPAERLLQEYKAQQHVERGFRFLKDPLFFTSSVFVKKPQRVEALALVMALTLLVYSLGQRQLRAQLAHCDETVLDQKRKPTRKPTLRWVFQAFQAIHLVTTDARQQVSNLSDERRKIIRLMGFPCCRYYLLN